MFYEQKVPQVSQKILPHCHNRQKLGMLQIKCTSDDCSIKHQCGFRETHELFDPVPTKKG